jgi:dTDP-4-dehydrorhamnose 3,5-epimerase-like enzyme
MGDARGNLVVIEGKKEIPFDIKRIFYIYGADPSAVRGQHANRNSEFVLININGSSKVRVKDGKGNEEVFILDRPYIGLYIPKMLWKDMYNFSHDAILLVLASEYYDAGEYIRNYEDFEKEVNGYE